MNQTTIEHKFKKGDKVKMVNGTSNVWFKIIGYDFFAPEINNKGFIAYQLSNPLNTHIFWITEDRLQMAEVQNETT